MTAHLHRLDGCSPTPLASYLKALGVLRLVAEQADPDVRGWWQDERFCLLTTLDRDGLERFFLERYAPTPLVSPWNKGSGFFHPNDPALRPIESSSAPRFAAFRAGIATARAGLADLAEADAAVRALKERTKKKKGMSKEDAEHAKALKDDPAFKQALAEADRRFKSLKADLFSPIALFWRGPHRDWFDAAMVLSETGDPSFPSLLGTGGNDGRLDFTNNGMQRLGELFDLTADGEPRVESPALLAACLWSTMSKDLQAKAAIGQFSPGQAGGANASTGPDADSLVNPWDFVLMLEGCILFSARSTRRLDPSASSRASAPFVVHAHACGHASPGNEKSARGEQWMPLWSQPCTLHDLRAMLGESRLQIGRLPANRPLDAARAIATLGTARGLDGFIRYGYLERNGQSNLAVPLGRIAVRERPDSRLVDDLAPWLDRLGRLARDDHAPARLIQAERRLGNAVFAALTHDSSPERWQTVLLAAQAIEAIQTSGTAFQAGPIPRLGSDWLAAADDGSAAWRLACALASAAAVWKRGVPQDAVRAHWLPLDAKRPGRYRTSDAGKRLAQDPRLVVRQRGALGDAIAVIERRLIEAGRHGGRQLPLQSAPGYAATWADLADLLAGHVDLDLILRLAQPLMALDWRRVPPRAIPWQSPPREPAWLALRLCCLSDPLPDGRRIPCDPALVRRLAAGDAASALAIALRRLGSAGVRPPLRAGTADPATARRWAAAQIFPITSAMAAQAIAHLHPTAPGASRD